MHRSLILPLVALLPYASPSPADAQAAADEVPHRVRVSLAGGLGLPSGGSRYTSTAPGGLVEGSLRFDVSARWQLGLGGAWGTFSGDVPQFSVFEPFDHDPWLEHTSVFAEARFVANADARTTPFLGARVGRTSELAEYSGATVRRAGPAASLLGGISIRLLPSVSIDASGDLGFARFGDGRLEGVSGVAPAANAVQLAARVGVELGIRR